MILIILLLQFQLDIIDDDFFTNFLKNNEKYIESLIKKSERQKCIEKNIEVEPFFIFPLATTKTLDKSHFYSLDTLFGNLNVSVNKRDVPINYSFFYNEQNKILFEFDDRDLLYCYSDYFYEQVLDYAKRRGISYLFNIDGSNISIYFAVVDSQLFVLDLRTGNLIVSKASNFVKENWSELFP